MRINVFDPHPDAIDVWQRASQPLGLLFFSFRQLSELSEPVRAEVGLLVIDRSLIETDFCPTIARLCLNFPRQQVIATGQDLSISDTVQAMHSGAAYAFDKPLDRALVAGSLLTIIDRARKIQKNELEYRRLSHLFFSLTHREKGVLDLVLKGVPNRESAQQLEVSVRTVEARRAKVYSKLECNNLVDLVRKMEQLVHFRQMFERQAKPFQLDEPTHCYRPNFLDNIGRSANESSFSLDSIANNN